MWNLENAAQPTSIKPFLSNTVRKLTRNIALMWAEAQAWSWFHGRAEVGLHVCLQWALLSDGGIVPSVWYSRSVGHYWKESKVMTYKLLKWNWVLKTMKSFTAASVCAFDAVIFDLWSFYPSGWTPLLRLSLFQPTCQPIDIQQSLLSSAASVA